MPAQAQIASMGRTQQSLTDEIDELEQYSRRNCLVFHGLPENSAAAGNENTTEAILKVAGSLGVHLDAGCSRVAQGAYLELEVKYIRNVLSVSGTLKYADSGTA